MLDAHTETLKGVLGLDSFSELLVLVFVFFSLLDEFLNLFLGKTAFVVGNGDLSILVCSFVSGLNVHYSILVELKSDLYLRNSSRSRRNIGEVELAEKIVVSSHLSLPLEDLDQYSRLVVTVGCEYLRFLGGDG
jgi:hypothetical protein